MVADSSVSVSVRALVDLPLNVTSPSNDLQYSGSFVLCCFFLAELFREIEPGVFGLSPPHDFNHP